MREKSYFEVLAEVEERKYRELNVQCELGEACAQLIELIERDKEIRRPERLVEVNGKRYNISISEWKDERWNT